MNSMPYELMTINHDCMNVLCTMLEIANLIQMY